MNMYKFLLCALLFASTLKANAQSDIEIAKSLLGQPYGQANAILSKMHVWYHYHFRETKSASGDDTKPKFYSIQNGDKVTKVWIIKYDKEKIIDEITVNFRHDDRGQVEDAQKVAVLADDFHIGVYSTDIIFRWKR